MAGDIAITWKRERTMLKFSSLDLQQQTGEIQRAVAREPVLITSYGKGRSVMLSTEEYRRLKREAEEPVPPELIVARCHGSRADLAVGL
jgi:prevent-host-death family protein